ESGTGGVPQSGSGAATGAGGAPSTGGSLGSEEEYPFPANAPAETGASLWLRFPELPIPQRLAEYRAAFTHVVSEGSSATLDIAQGELTSGLSGLTDAVVTAAQSPSGGGAVLIGTPSSSQRVAALPLASQLPALGSEGYLVTHADVDGQATIVV